jgi:hypothetical protein
MRQKAEAARVVEWLEATEHDLDFHAAAIAEGRSLLGRSSRT